MLFHSVPDFQGYNMPETYSEMDVHVYYLACGAHVKKKISMLFSEGQDLQNLVKGGYR